ncbi:DNA-directed DNA polymerase II small subunit [Halovivax sp.]|uniref:DNA-directed DNA polymerase II small subunit n=1 Tax=Halovivax sp. TaxID=1935978 RepID=UPI0025C46FC2|nr:DNA-directed DNA polymerase II small subunit [Halovivax sp.]
MPLEGPARIVRELTSRGYNAEREAVTLIASRPDAGSALERVLEQTPDDALVITTDDVRSILDGSPSARTDRAETRPPETVSNPPESSEAGPSETGSFESDARDGAIQNPSVSTGESNRESGDGDGVVPVETGGFERSVDPDRREVAIRNDMTGESTGTGEYRDFVAVFRDRLERLGAKLRGRVNHRPASSIESMPGGSEVAMVGMVNDVRSTKSGHWLVELEDTTGAFPWLVMKDREYVDLVEELLCDEVIAMEGTLSDDSGIAFVDSMYFPDVPRTNEPSTADRHVQAALISDVHVGSDEFMADAWDRFARWLHTEPAEHVEYLLIAGDMVEGVGVYPDQDEELEIVDIYDQYDAFNEHLKAVPGDLEIVMIPGNHDAVRLAEPQPGFDEELRQIMSAHDPRIVSNPSTVELEGVSILMYHGVSLDEVIAELPAEKASYDEPHKAMYQLLKKRHIAPQFGGHTRLAPEERDYLVIEDVPDIFHTGHVHKLGFGKYHDVLAINSGCWQSQTDFQKSVNIDPDAGYAPIVDLDTLEVTVQKFS